MKLGPATQKIYHVLKEAGRWFTPIELAHQIGVTPWGASKCLGRLVEEGLVEKRWYGWKDKDKGIARYEYRASQGVADAGSEPG